MGPGLTVLVIAAVVQGSQPLDSNGTVHVSDVEGPWGLCAVLLCSYTLPAGLDPNQTTVAWYKRQGPSPGTAVYDQGQAQSEYRYRARLWRSLRDLDCSLIISSLTVGDQGRFDVRISHPEMGQTLNGSLLLNVSDQVKPNITSAAEILDNVPATLTCTAPLTCQGNAPQLTWDGLTHLNSTVVLNGTHNSSLTFLPSVTDHDKEVLCLARYPVIRAETNQTFRLDVKYAPKIGEIPPQSADEGGQVAVQCNVSSNPVSRVWWSPAGNGTITGTENGTTLLIRNVDRIQQGRYVCRAENQYGEAAREVNLTVNYAPSILEMNRTVTVQEGTNFTYMCRADGQPEPNITWFRESADPGSAVSSRPELTLHNASGVDSGRYICRAGNRLGSANRSVLITVGYAPRNLIIELEGNGTAVSRVETEEGESLSLRCSVQSLPDSNLTWTVNGAVRKSSLGSYELWLLTEQVTYKEAGEYQCTARNVLGQAQTGLQVTLQYSPKDVVVDVSGGRPIREGDNVTLKCSCTANPPTVNTSWYRVAPGGGAELVATSRTLNLGRVTREEDSAYLCTVTNTRGSANSSLYRLTFQYQPEISRESGCTRTSQDIICVCAASSNPPGELTWRLPVANLSGNQTHGRFQAWQVADGQLVTGSLTLRGGEGEEETTAWCTVRNLLGEVSFKVYLWVRGQRPSFQELLIPALGSAAGTLILTLLFCQILLCCSRRSKPVRRESTEMQVLTADPSPEDGAGAIYSSPQHHPSERTPSLTMEEGEPCPEDGAEEGNTDDAGPPPEQNGEVGAAAGDEDAELHYACIDFSKSRTSDEIVGVRDSTQYAQIKPQ